MKVIRDCNFLLGAAAPTGHNVAPPLLLANIRRRRGAAGGSAAALGAKAGASRSGGSESESELERLRREQQEARAQLLDMERRVRGTERRQEQRMAFLERTVGSPSFLDGLLARRGSAAPVEAGRKRRLLDAA